MTTPALDALRALLPLLARDEDRAVTGIFGGDTLNAIDAARALIGDDDADDAGLRHESVEAKPWVIDGIRALEAAVRHEAACVEAAKAEIKALRAEIERLQSNLTAGASAFAALEAAAAEARRNDAIAMSWIAEAKHAIGYEGDMPGFIEALRALKATANGELMHPTVAGDRYAVKKTQEETK